MHDFKLRTGIEPAPLRDRFAIEGHVRIEGFLAERSARLLHGHLLERRDWKQMINSGAKLFELDRATREAMTAEKRAALDLAVHAGAERGFQHRYEAIRVADDGALRATAHDPLTAFVRFMADADTLRLIAAITRRRDIGLADGQATAYGVGDFLTEHDDAVPGKGRRAAYVLGLTAAWRPSWGGLLLFHKQSAVTGWSPGFNTLDLFSVPQRHSVSMVTPAATARRYAITGWLRTPTG